LQLRSGTPEAMADGGQVWVCQVLPYKDSNHGR
jgi:hypothetical protein